DASEPRVGVPGHDASEPRVGVPGHDASEPRVGVPGTTTGAPRHGTGRSSNGEVFVLEMGEPVRIIDLADTMIRLSGFEPGRDIAIEIVGARPGEKFHEDLFNPYERMQPTPAQKILRAEHEP